MFYSTSVFKKIMADQRSKTKVMIGVYVEEETRDLIKEILSERGVTITDFIVAQFYKLLNNEENEILEKLQMRDGRTKKAKAAKNSKIKKGTL